MQAFMALTPVNERSRFFGSQSGHSILDRKRNLLLSLPASRQALPLFWIERASETHGQWMEARKAAVTWPSVEGARNIDGNNRCRRSQHERAYARKKGLQIAVLATPSFREPNKDIAAPQDRGAKRKSRADAEHGIDLENAYCPAKGPAPAARKQDICGPSPINLPQDWPGESGVKRQG